MPGLFITFEGLDGSGKSTHLRRAEDWLRARGLPVLVTREPGGTPIGDALRGIFLGHQFAEMDPRVEALLVFASRRQQLVEKIEPALARGIHVLCDRFTDSSLAYQGAARGLGAEWVAQLDLLATGGRRPDLTLLFDLPAALAQNRSQRSHRKDGAGPDRIDAENLAFYDRVRQAYLEMAEREPDRFRVLDSTASPERTFQAVATLLASTFGAGS
jgi:dTMP kinase